MGPHSLLPVFPEQFFHVTESSGLGGNLQLSISAPVCWLFPPNISHIHQTLMLLSLFENLLAIQATKTKQKKVWGERNPSSAGLCPEMGKVPATPLSLLCCPYWFSVDGSRMLWGEQSSEAELTCIRRDSLCCSETPCRLSTGITPTLISTSCACGDGFPRHFGWIRCVVLLVPAVRYGWLKQNLEKWDKMCHSSLC